MPGIALVVALAATSYLYSSQEPKKAASSVTGSSRTDVVHLVIRSGSESEADLHILSVSRHTGPVSICHNKWDGHLSIDSRPARQGYRGQDFKEDGSLRGLASRRDRAENTHSVAG